MDGGEETDVVCTEGGERGREGGQWEGPVSHRPETRIEDQHSELPLTIKVTL